AWVRIDVGAELDLVGPIAGGVVTRHGVLYPPTAHMIVPLLREARGGTLVTGIDGGALFRTWRRAPTAAGLRGQVRPTANDLLRLGLALAPAWVRSRKLARDHPVEAPWLLPEARDLVSSRYAANLAALPTNWPGYLDWISRERARTLYRRSLE